MERYKEEVTVQHASIVEAQKEYLAKVYAWMVGGLVTTGIVSAIILSSDSFTGWLEQNFTFVWILFFVKLFMVGWLAGWTNKMSAATATGTFLAYAGLNGVTLSMLALRYTTESIAASFFMAAAMFAAMSVYGFVTKRDLSGIGSFMFMGLIGIIIASVANVWIGGSALHFAISVAGVVIFTGLTAYDTQKIKEMYLVELEGGAVARKTAILGALSLYLDFINLFIFLLRLLGSRR